VAALWFQNDLNLEKRKRKKKKEKEKIIISQNKYLNTLFKSYKNKRQKWNQKLKRKQKLS
jgi:hypothetical protein